MKISVSAALIALTTQLPSSYAYATQKRASGINLAQEAKKEEKKEQKVDYNKNPFPRVLKDLPFDKDEHERVKPNEDGSVPEDNLCQQIEWGSHAVAFNSTVAVEFFEHFEELADHAIELLEHGHPIFEKEYPDSLNPFHVFKIEEIDHEHIEKQFEGLIDHYGLDSDEPHDENGPLPREIAQRVFHQTIEMLEYARDFFTFGEHVLHSTEHEIAEDAEKAVEEIHEAIEEFYHETLNPLRRSYDIYSRAPLNRETVAHLRRDIVDGLREGHQAMLGLRDLGVEFYPTGSYDKALATAAMLTDLENHDEEEVNYRLKRLIWGSRFIIENYSKEIKERGLEHDDEIMELYNKMSDSLFRINNGNKSVRCLSIWALQRRRFQPTWFEHEILDGVDEFPERIKTEHTEDFLDATEWLHSGYNQLDSVTDHLKEQHDYVHKYLWSGGLVFDELVQQNWEQHKNDKPVRPSAGRFFNRYYRSMRQWRWSLYDEAI